MSREVRSAARSYQENLARSARIGSRSVGTDIGILDVRGTMETTNGALIYVAYIGTVDLGENAYDEFL